MVLRLIEKKRDKESFIPSLTLDELINYIKKRQQMKLQEIERLESYLIAKNNSYPIYGLTKEEVINELLLNDDEVEKFLKRKFVFSIGEVLRILEKIEDGELKSFKKNKSK